MNDENVPQPEPSTALKWRDQPRVMARMLTGIALLVGGIIWAVLEQNAESRWVIWGFIPVPWFLIVAGALAFTGEAIKKPKQ